LNRRLASVAVLAASVAGACLAQGNEPIIVGQTSIASGPVAGFSKEPGLGIQAMLASVNKAGGIRGRQVVLRQLDDGNSAEKAEANVRTLVQQGAVAILMPIGTLPAAGAMKAADELKVPVIAPYTGAGQVYAAGSAVFPLRNQLHKDMADGAAGVVIMQVVPSPKAPIRLAVDYRAAMEAIGAGQQLSYASFEGYIATRTLVEALRRAAAAPIKPAAVQQALQSMNRHDLGGLTISFRDQAQGALNYGELSMIGRDGFLVR